MQFSHQINLNQQFYLSLRLLQWTSRLTPIVIIIMRIYQANRSDNQEINEMSDNFKIIIWKVVEDLIHRQFIRANVSIRELDQRLLNGELNINSLFRSIKILLRM